VSGIISAWVSRLRGRRGGPESWRDEASFLEVTADSEGLLTIRSLLLDRPLFRMRAALAPAGERGGGRLEIPLAASGSSRPWLRVEVQRSGEPVPGSVAFLVRSHGERKRDSQTLVFQLESPEAGVRYVFEGDSDLEVLDVASATPLPSLFDGVPSAQDMASFLNQLTHGRRRVPQILGSLARCASPAAAARAQELAARWPAEAEPQPLVQALGRLFEERGHRVNSESLEAFCLLVDLERGAGPGISPAAALAVADLFAFPLDQEAWDSNFAQFGSFSEALEGAHEPGAVRLLEKLRQQRRTPLDILEDLAGDSQSRRVAAAVRILKPLLPGGRIRVNEEQLALLPLLQDSGRPVHPETMLALCLFVDLETGDLDRERLQALSTGANTLDTSMYAMVAVAGAFGLELEAFALEPEPGDSEAHRVGRLATRAEGGLLACFRRAGEAGRRWEWVRGAEDFLRAEGHGLDFSGIFLARLVGDGREPLQPLDPARLHDHGEVLSRQQLALRQIQAALRRMAGEALDRVFLSQESSVLEAACEWLGSGGAARILDPLVPPETRRQLVASLSRGGLDVRADRRLLAAAGAQPALELLGLLLLQQMALSPHLKLNGTFRHFDDRAMRATLLERVTELAASPEVTLRTLAVRLMASADLAADRATRLGMEYPLGLARADLDAGVQAAAVEALTRLALVDLVALPQAVEVVPFQEGQGVVRSVLSEADCAGIASAVQGWLEQVARVDSVRPMGLPITDAEGSLDPELSRPLIELLATLQQASRHDGSLSRARWLALASLEDLAAAGRALLEAWRLLARQEGRGLEELDPEACSLEFRLLVEDQAPRLLQRCGGLPSLGGPGRPLNLYRQAPGRSLGPLATFEKYRGVVVTEEAPMFTEILERARRADLRRVRVLRLPGFNAAQAEGLPDLQTARLDTTVELREVEVLDPVTAAFQPLPGWLARSRTELGLDSEPAEDLQAVVALASGRKPQPIASRVEEDASPARDGPSGRDPEALPRVAAALARQFELEGAQERLQGLLLQILG
jgi:hypothetical protein